MEDKITISITLPKSLEDRIYKLRTQERFCKASKAELIRMLLDIGLKSIDSKQND